SPNSGSFDNLLYGVTALAPNNAWAVGTYSPSGAFSDYQPQTMHWDGSVWSIVPSPNLSIGYNGLQAVTALSGNDVWAVGYRPGGTLTMHWDGGAWSVVPSPAMGAFGYLTGVVANSPSDIWAVGFYESLQFGHLYQTLTLHWNGSAWSAVF